MRKITFLFFCACIFCNPFSRVSAQIITSIAGISYGGFSGDGGPATAAQVYQPIGITVDHAGNIYFAEFSNHIIRKINTAGIISTIAGTGGTSGFSGDGGAASLALLFLPTNISLDDTGNIYIADEGNGRIRKINTAGIITTIAGNGTSFYSGDGGDATLASLHSPNGIIADNHGNFYISDRENHRIRKVNNLGIITTIAGNGTEGHTGDGGLATAAALAAPAGICVDASGNLLFADKGANCIRKISTTGTITTVAGTGTSGYSGDGGAANLALLDSPTDVITDAIGNMYIADDNNSRIRKVSTSGIISTVAGNGTEDYSGDNGPATAATLFNPNGVAVDNMGSIYIADLQNNRVRKVTPLDKIPVFTAGASQAITLCENAGTVLTNAYLAVADSDTAQNLSWTLLVPPSHGSAIAAYTATANADTITPAGLSYTPEAGYSGTDSFTVRISDGIAVNTTTIIVTITPTPSAGALSGPGSVCPGGTIALSSTVLGGTWQSANTTATIDSDGMVTGIMNGTDTITYTVNSGGCVAMSHKTITVGLSIDSIFGGPKAVCAGSSIGIATAVDSGTWSTTSTTATVTDLGNDSARITGISGGIAIITYSVTNSCGTARIYDTITVKALPTLSSTLTPAAVCDNIAFHYEPASDPTATFSWSRAAVSGISNTTNSDSGTINELLNDTTNHPVTVTYLIAINNNGCTDTEAITVSIKPTPTLIASPADTICSGQALEYVLSSTAAGTPIYTWNRGAAAGVSPTVSSGSGNITETLINTTAGYVTTTYEVTVSYDGCSSTAPVNVVITPFGAGIAPVITTHTPSVVCNKMQFQNFGFGITPVTGVDYKWTTQGGAIVWATGNTEQYCLVNFTNPGLARILLNATSPGTQCASKDTFTVLVSETEAEIPQIVLYNNSFTCLQNDGYTYQWGYDNILTLDSTFLPGETNQSYYNAEPDLSNKLYWLITTHNDCQQKTYYNSPAVAAVINKAALQTIILPNPNTGTFDVTVAATGNELAKVIITDMTGREVKAMQVWTNRVTAVTADAPAGVYLLSAVTTAGRVTTKIIISR